MLSLTKNVLLKTLVHIFASRHFHSRYSHGKLFKGDIAKKKVLEFAEKTIKRANAVAGKKGKKKIFQAQRIIIKKGKSRTTIEKE